MPISMCKPLSFSIHQTVIDSGLLDSDQPFFARLSLARGDTVHGLPSKYEGRSIPNNLSTVGATSAICGRPQSSDSRRALQAPGADPDNGHRSMLSDCPQKYYQ